MGYDLLIVKEKEFDKFVAKLNIDTKSRLVRDISFLKEHGKELHMPFAKKINSKLFELRTSGKQKVRIIYSIREKQIFVVNWFIKKSNKIPKKEICLAMKRLT